MSVLKKTLFFIAALLAASVLADAPSLSIGQYPKSVYLGDTVSLSVTLHDFDDTKSQPEFGNKEALSAITFHGSHDSTSLYESWVNGKRVSRRNSDRTFSYSITPVKEGKFTTGEISVHCASKVLTAPECTFMVIGPKSNPEIFCSLDCNYQSVLVDSSFKVVFTLTLRALPTPFETTEPLFPDKPLHISAEYLNFEEIAGLTVPTPDKALGPLVSRGTGKVAFTINKYIVQQPFSAYAQRFHLDADMSERNGTNYWTYSLPIEYTASEIGEYSFGPAYVKGEIPVLLDDRGTCRREQVFVLCPALKIKVIPPPEEGRPAWYVGAIGSSMQIKAALDTEHCKVGDPLSLTVDITGDINTQSISPPDISAQLGKQEDFKIYDGNVETIPVSGGKQFKYRIRPLRPGTFEFPEIKAAFFNAKQGEYFTIESEPMPLQVEATTQIAATADDSGLEDKSAVNLIPDGIIMTREDRKPRSLTVFGKYSLVILLGSPLCLLLLTAAGKFLILKIRKHHSSTRLSRNASSAFRELQKTADAAKKGDPEAGHKAIRAARTCIASLLGNDAASVTKPDIVSGLSSRGVSMQDAETTGSLFADLENSIYSGNTDKNSLAEQITRLSAAIAKAKSEIRPAKFTHAAKTSVMLLVAAAVIYTCIPSKTIAAVNSDFEWDRANRRMASAKTEADFLKAANLYFGIVTNGTSSGPLYYNLGTALILAGKPQAAIESFKEAEIYLGTSREISDNWKIANAKITGSGGEIPISRTFFSWHYGLDLATRTDIAVICWILLCIFMFPVVLIPAASSSSFAKTFRRCCLVLALITALGALFYGTSAILYYRHSNSSFNSLPGVELSLQPSGQSEEAGK